MAMPPRVEALLFDLGNVVIDIDFGRALRAWARHSRLPLDEVRTRFRMDEAYERHERGEIDAAAYFGYLRRMLELDATDDDIAAGWNAIFTGEIAQTVQLIRSVRTRIPCHAFTNSNPTHQAAWTAAYPAAIGAFGRVFVSSELGLRKPERAAFGAVAGALGLDPAAILFFDDTEKNVDGARAAGLQAVHVRAPADVACALAGLGLR